jgi:hypothetical protein
VSILRHFFYSHEEGGRFDELSALLSNPAGQMRQLRPVCCLHETTVEEMKVADDGPRGGEGAAQSAGSLSSGERGLSGERGPQIRAPCRPKLDAVSVARVLLHERLAVQDVACSSRLRPAAAEIMRGAQYWHI